MEIYFSDGDETYIPKNASDLPSLGFGPLPVLQALAVAFTMSSSMVCKLIHYIS